jgi:3-hydroxybutyryl-CoA dehydrogenase
MNYSIIQSAPSRAFTKDHPLVVNATENADANVILGARASEALHVISDHTKKIVVLIELGTECLGVLTGESRGREGSNVLGFARFRLGDGEPSNLVELVRQPKTSQAAIDAAQEIFTAAGLQVALCNDFAGRIIDRLVRPYYNAALRRLDEGLASVDDLDTTLKLGLGYPEGPIALLERTGLHHHFDVSQALFEAYGESAYAPARGARVAKQRQGK